MTTQDTTRNDVPCKARLAFAMLLSFCFGAACFGMWANDNYSAYTGLEVLLGMLFFIVACPAIFDNILHPAIDQTK